MSSPSALVPYAENCCTFSEGDLIPRALGVLISALGGAVVGYREEQEKEAGSCPHGHERENRKLLGIPGCDKTILWTSLFNPVL